MEATIVDLRYKMNDVLKALSRRERVKILYHGAIKGIIIPANIKNENIVEAHPFFGMHKNIKSDPLDVLAKLRNGRYNDI